MSHTNVPVREAVERTAGGHAASNYHWTRNGAGQCVDPRNQTETEQTDAQMANQRRSADTSAL
jgi:hypothetical protein